MGRDLGRYEGGITEVPWVRDLKTNLKANSKANAMQEGRGKTI
jgi:hypothetical protein